MKSTASISTANPNYQVDSLNESFRGLEPVFGLQRLFNTFAAEDIMVTTSFGTKSIYLLYLLQQVAPGHPVYFIDTGFHFPETLTYRDSLIRRLGLNIVTINPHPEEHALTKEESWWIEHPKMCCSINKIAPLQPYIEKHKVWVSSLMAYQNEYRANLHLFEQQGDILKFHPLLEVSEESFNKNLDELDLPIHPLFYLGYESIGCMHCTQPGKGREGRWAGKTKTECGLHLKYFTKHEHA
ncbi:MAG: phosphoadenylyl-sulfate reductase [Saprospiraceae bacterium]